MPIIKERMVINLQVGIRSVCLLATHMTRKRWKLFDLETKEIFVSRDVEFVETKYPFSIDGLSQMTPM